jgi:hypothetical protein
MKNHEKHVELLNQAKQTLQSILSSGILKEMVEGHKDLPKMVSIGVEKAKSTEEWKDDPIAEEFVLTHAKISLTRAAIAFIGVGSYLKDHNFPEDIALQVGMKVADIANEIGLDSSWSITGKGELKPSEAFFIGVEADRENKVLYLISIKMPDSIVNLLQKIHAMGSPSETPETPVDKPTLH